MVDKTIKKGYTNIEKRKKYVYEKVKKIQNRFINNNII